MSTTDRNRLAFLLASNQGRIMLPPLSHDRLGLLRQFPTTVTDGQLRRHRLTSLQCPAPAHLSHPPGGEVPSSLSEHRPHDQPDLA